MCSPRGSGGRAWNETVNLSGSTLIIVLSCWYYRGVCVLMLPIKNTKIWGAGDVTSVTQSPSNGVNILLYTQRKWCYYLCTLPGYTQIISSANVYIINVPACWDTALPCTTSVYCMLLCCWHSERVRYTQTWERPTSVSPVCVPSRNGPLPSCTWRWPLVHVRPRKTSPRERCDTSKSDTSFFDLKLPS
jgi:hypothetical protein